MRYNKIQKVLAVSLCMGMFLSSFSFSYGDSSKTITVLVNGEAVEFDADPEIVSDRTFVPMRAIFEALGAEVNWDNQRKEAIATLGANEVVLKIGSTVGIHGTTADVLEAAPYIKDSRTMVPLRYLSESLGYEVDWDNDTRTVSIVGKENESVEDTDADTDSAVSSKPVKTDKDGNEIVTDGSYKYSILTYHDLNAPAVSINGTATDLTYNNVVKRFLYVDTNLNQAKLSDEQSEQSLKEFYQLHTSYDLTDLEDQALEALRLANNWTSKNYVVTAEQEAYSIVSEMDSISLQLASIKHQETKLDEAKAKLANAEISYRAGAISQSDLKTAKRNVESEELSLDALKVELEGMYVSLYGSLEYEQTDYAEPQFSLDYEPIGEVDLKLKYSADLNNDPYIWYVEHAEDNAEYNVKTYVYNYSAKSKKLTVMDLTQARMNTNQTKQNLLTAEYSRYNQILQIENSIASLDDSIDTLRDNIDTMRTQYEAGVISKDQFENVLRSEEDLKFNRLKLMLSHKQAVDTFKIMYLNPSYMSMGGSR